MTRPVVDEATIRRYLDLDCRDTAAYFLSGEVIYFTDLKLIQTFVLLIEPEHIYAACVSHLRRVGVPDFDDARQSDAYGTALENGLRQGLVLHAARLQALRAAGYTLSPRAEQD